MNQIDRDVSAFDRPPEDRPKIFHAVGVDVPVHLADSMVNHFVGVTVITEANLIEVAAFLAESGANDQC
jgi:hypothetical protein